MKKCNKCLKDLSFSMFNKDNKTKDGYTTKCKLCIKEYDKQRYELNKKKLKEQTKIYYNNNIKYYSEYHKKYNKINSVELKNKKKIYDKMNLEKKKQYFIEKRKNNPLFNLSCFYRSMLNNCFKNKGYIKNEKCNKLLGCSFEEFKIHLESRFEDWMNWDNKGNPKDGVLEPNKTWDIDHIIPISTAITEDEIIKLNHYTNLQPLCSYTNRFIKKNNQ